jgi:uncharacterized protein with PIN domain
MKEEKPICPSCDGPMKLVKRTYKLGGFVLYGTEMYECTLCEQEVFTEEQSQDTVRRAKRAKAKLKGKKNVSKKEVHGLDKSHTP